MDNKTVEKGTEIKCPKCGGTAIASIAQSGSAGDVISLAPENENLIMVKIESGDVKRLSCQNCEEFTYSLGEWKEK